MKPAVARNRWQMHAARCHGNQVMRPGPKAGLLHLLLIRPVSNPATTIQRILHIDDDHAIILYTVYTYIRPCALNSITGVLCSILWSAPSVVEVENNKYDVHGSNKKLSYCLEIARHESLPTIAQMTFRKMSFRVIKSGANWKLVYDFLLVPCSNFCRITHRLREIWCDSLMTLKYRQGHRHCTYHLKVLVHDFLYK